jgi:hypothetical protein
MSARILAFNFLVQLLFAGCCVAQGVDPGPIRVGDLWSYEVTDALTGSLKHVATLVVLEISEKEINGTDHIPRQGRASPRSVRYRLEPN